MLCCIIAAYLWALAVATLRRWMIYWGLVRRQLGEESYATLWGDVNRLLAR